MISDNHVIDQLPAYALSSLEPEEQAAVARHLEGCAHCQAELRTYQTVVGQLGFAAPLVNPPAGLKDKILAGVQPAGEPSRGQTRPRGGVSWLKLNWGLVGLFLAVALIASNLFWWAQVQRMQTSAGESNFRAVALATVPDGPDASGVVIISRDGEHGTLVVDGLPILSEEQQYQLWLIDDDGTRTSGGVFSVDEEGYGALWVHASRPLVSFPAVGITIEPAGGSPGPTGPKVLGGEL